MLVCFNVKAISSFMWYLYCIIFFSNNFENNVISDGEIKNDLNTIDKWQIVDNMKICLSTP